jgi:hypothetical protein
MVIRNLQDEIVEINKSLIGNVLRCQPHLFLLVWRGDKIPENAYMVIASGPNAETIKRFDDAASAQVEISSSYKNGECWTGMINGTTYIVQWTQHGIVTGIKWPGGSLTDKGLDDPRLSRLYGEDIGVYERIIECGGGDGRTQAMLIGTKGSEMLFYGGNVHRITSLDQLESFFKPKRSESLPAAPRVISDPS